MQNLQLKELLHVIGRRDGEYVAGTVSGIIGALATSLFHFVIDLQTGKKKYRGQEEIIEKIQRQLKDVTHQFIAQAEEDAHAYSGVVTARRLCQTTENEKKLRQEAIDQALVEASEPQIKMMSLCEEILDIYESVQMLAIQGSVVGDIKVSLLYLEAVILTCELTARANYEQIVNLDLRRKSLHALKQQKNYLITEITNKQADIQKYLDCGYWEADNE